jgi:hypothetical protein
MLGTRGTLPDSEFSLLITGLLGICVRRTLRSANPEEMNADVSSNAFMYFAACYVSGGLLQGG